MWTVGAGQLNRIEDHSVVDGCWWRTEQVGGTGCRGWQREPPGEGGGGGERCGEKMAAFIKHYYPRFHMAVGTVSAVSAVPTVSTVTTTFGELGRWTLCPAWTL